MAEVFNEKMQSNHILQVMEIVERLCTTTERWKVLPSCRNSELRPLPQGQPTKGVERAPDAQWSVGLKGPCLCYRRRVGGGVKGGGWTHLCVQSRAEWDRGNSFPVQSCGLCTQRG